MKEQEQETNAALDLSVRTSARALREVERLKRQRRILAQHVGIMVGQIGLHRRIIAELRIGAESSQTDGLRKIQRQEEEIDLLRDEVSQLTQRLLQYRASTDADRDAVFSESWEMAKRLRIANHEIERLRRQRRNLASHLRAYIHADRQMRAWINGLVPARSPWHLVDDLFRGLRTAFRWALKWAERIPLTLVAGRRNAAEMQEALDG